MHNISIYMYIDIHRYTYVQTIYTCMHTHNDIIYLHTSTNMRIHVYIIHLIMLYTYVHYSILTGLGMETNCTSFSHCQMMYLKIVHVYIHVYKYIRGVRLTRLCN